MVGRELVDRLRQSGEAVFALGGRSNCDLESTEATLELFRSISPEKVYHLAAAVFGVGGNLAFPGDVFRRNTLINVNVVEAARLCGAQKIVAMGSAAIYADGLTLPYAEADALEGQPHASEYPYAFSKRGLLVQLESYRKQFGLDYAYAISTNLYGPHDRFNVEHGHVIPSLLAKFEAARRSGALVSIWGDGSPTRDFLYAEDAATGLVAMMERGLGRYNLASGRACSIRDLVQTISAFYPDVSFAWDTSKPLGQLARAYATERLSEIGFTAQVDLHEGLKRTIGWLRANYDRLRT
jgi:GDP-L-fucose synthase